MNDSAKVTIALLLIVLSIAQSGCDSGVVEKPMDEAYASGIVPVQLTDANFQAEVIESDLSVLVDMWAPWCQPCIEMKPALRDLASDLLGQVKVAELNIDENLFIKQKYNVEQYPTLLIFVDGVEVHRTIGLQSKLELLEVLKNHAPFQVTGNP